MVRASTAPERWQARPANQNKRLRNGERDRLKKLLDVVQEQPGRKHGAASRTN